MTFGIEGETDIPIIEIEKLCYLKVFKSCVTKLTKMLKIRRKLQLKASKNHIYYVNWMLGEPYKGALNLSILISLDIQSYWESIALYGFTVSAMLQYRIDENDCLLRSHRYLLNISLLSFEYFHSYLIRYPFHILRQTRLQKHFNTKHIKLSNVSLGKSGQNAILFSAMRRPTSTLRGL